MRTVKGIACRNALVGAPQPRAIQNCILDGVPQSGECRRFPYAAHPLAAGHRMMIAADASRTAYTSLRPHLSGTQAV